MTNFDPQAAMAAITAKGISPSCPACRTGQLGLETGGFTQVSTSTASDEVTVGVGQQVLPGVALTCQNCGFTQIFNATILGLT